MTLTWGKEGKEKVKEVKQLTERKLKKKQAKKGVVFEEVSDEKCIFIFVYT